MHLKIYQRLLAIFIFTQTIVLGACDEERLNEIVSEIRIGDINDPEYSLCEEDQVRKCVHSFLPTATGAGDTLSFVIENSGASDLEIYSLKLEGDPAFSFNEDPLNGKEMLVIPAYSKQEVEKGLIEAQEIIVRFSPTVAGEGLTARIVIESNASNLKDGENLIIRLLANSLDIGQPIARIEPAECNFGEVGVGVKAFCDVSIHNDGARDLKIESTDWDDASSWGSRKTFFSDTILALPAYVSPGTAMTIRFTATPKDSIAQENTFLIGTNDPQHKILEVDLAVIGAEAPTAVAEIASINGVANMTATPNVEPLDNVIFTGTNSAASRPDLTVSDYQWEIIEKPPESSVTLGSPNSETTDFIFSSAAGIVHGVDVAGTFTVKLTVTDSAGAISSNEARVTLNSIPSDALHVQLTWDSPNYDFDLHLIKDSMNFCAQDSCYYGTCRESGLGLPGWLGGARPEWDGITGVTEGDPTLNIDDMNGYGPEDINIDVPIDANYKVGVHAYSPTLSEAVGLTLKVFVHGSLVLDEYQELSQGKAMWNVADIRWSNGNGTVFPINTVDQNNSCSAM